MDESSIYLDSTTNYTYAKKGSRRVKATTTGNERTRISAAYYITASGLKLPIYLILPRKTEIPEFEAPDNCKFYKYFFLFFFSIHIISLNRQSLL